MINRKFRQLITLIIKKSEDCGNPHLYITNQNLKGYYNMEFLIELVLDLFLEGSIEASKSKKTPKVIRWLLLLFIVVFFLGVIGIMLFVGLSIIEENILAGIFILLIGIFMLIASILKFKKVYLTKKR